MKLLLLSGYLKEKRIDYASSCVVRDRRMLHEKHSPMMKEILRERFRKPL